MRVLVCFAVPEEAAPFRRLAGVDANLRVIVTGMGRRNAERAIRGELHSYKPDLVLTCGFAGALNPALEFGAVLYAPENACGLAGKLAAAGARPARFHCAERVASGAAEKRRLATETRADAVEMESGWIAALCRQEGVSCVTVRVVLDTAEEDLPLDFNLLLDGRQRLSVSKLALALVRAPSKIPALIRLRKRSTEAAAKLARVLAAVLPGRG